MIKYFCDRVGCGKEIKEKATLIPIYAYDGKGIKIMQFGDKHICEDCAKKLEEIKDALLSNHYEQDFLQMTDEDIELLRYTFKVGDEVITDDGCVGIITDICDCDRCKERGFYEPKVEMKIGSQIYITDTDKKNGFINYYKIGDRVFGNINDKYLWDHMKTYKEAIKEIEARLNVINGLKKN